MYQSLIVDGIRYSRDELLKNLVPSLVASGPAWQIQIGEFIAEWLNGHDAIQVKTSGSTGIPKIIELSKQSMICSAQRTIRFFGLKPFSRALLCLPASYIAGRMMIVRAFVGEWDIHFKQPSHLRFDDGDCYDMAAMVPLQVEELLAIGYDLTPLGTVIIGGAACSQSLRSALSKFNVWETYGMTETVSHIALRKMGDEWFVPLEDVRLSVDRRHCLCIHAPGITREPVGTNDVVELLPDGRFRFLGRTDHVINSGGIKFFPEQIEQKIASCLSVSFVIIGVPDGLLVA